MERQAIWLTYFSICLILAVMMTKAAESKSYKIIGGIFCVTFLLFLLNYLLSNIFRQYAFMTTTFGYIYLLITVLY